MMMMRITDNKKLHVFHYNSAFNIVFTTAGSAIMMTFLATIIRLEESLRAFRMALSCS
jgi:hypothetical protein